MVTRSHTSFWAASPSASRKKKSSVLPPFWSGSLEMMWWAFSTMRLCLACRKISFRQTVGTSPERMTSPRMLPGPTLGSWSASPTIIMRQLYRRAAMRA